MPSLPRWKGEMIDGLGFPLHKTAVAPTSKSYRGTQKKRGKP